MGTKRQAREIIKEEAERAGCPYVNHRWLGGMLTNFKTVKQSIKRLVELETMMADGSIDKLKKEKLYQLSATMRSLYAQLAVLKK